MLNNPSTPDPLESANILPAQLQSELFGVRSTCIRGKAHVDPTFHTRGARLLRRSAAGGQIPSRNRMRKASDLAGGGSAAADLGGGGRKRITAGDGRVHASNKASGGHDGMRELGGNVSNVIALRHPVNRFLIMAKVGWSVLAACSALPPSDA